MYTEAGVVAIHIFLLYKITIQYVLVCTEREPSLDNGGIPNMINL